MLFINRRKLDYNNITTVLEAGNESDLSQLLWQPNNEEINYLPITISILSKLRKVEDSTDSLRIHRTIRKGKYELIIFQMPWISKEANYTPLIFDINSSKAVGVMLPFNELLYVLSAREQKQINNLGKAWLAFILPITIK